MAGVRRLRKRMLGCELRVPTPARSHARARVVGGEVAHDPEPGDKSAPGRGRVGS